MGIIWGKSADTEATQTKCCSLGGRSNGKEPDEPLNEGTGENHHGTNEESEGDADEMLAVRRRAK